MASLSFLTPLITMGQLPVWWTNIDGIRDPGHTVQDKRYDKKTQSEQGSNLSHSTWHRLEVDNLSLKLTQNISLRNSLRSIRANIYKRELISKQSFEISLGQLLCLWQTARECQAIFCLLKKATSFGSSWLVLPPLKQKVTGSIPAGDTVSPQDV